MFPSIKTFVLLNEEAAKRYIQTSLKHEYASEIGTDLNAVLPKLSPLNPEYLTKKQRVFRKIAAFVEKFKGVGGKVLPPEIRRPDCRLRIARTRHHRPPRRLQKLQPHRKRSRTHRSGYVERYSLANFKYCKISPKDHPQKRGKIRNPIVNIPHNKYNIFLCESRCRFGFFYLSGSFIF